MATSSRDGKHKRGKVRMGIYTEPFRKAVAVLTAKKLNITMTDLIWIGIENVAKAHGILDMNGKVSPEYRDALEAETVIVRQSEVAG